MESPETLATKLLESSAPIESLWEATISDLVQLGVCYVAGGELAVIVGDHLSDEQASALRFATDPEMAGWDWGVVYRTGGDGPVPVYGLKLDGPHAYLAIGI